MHRTPASSVSGCVCVFGGGEWGRDSLLSEISWLCSPAHFFWLSLYMASVLLSVGSRPSSSSSPCSVLQRAPLVSSLAAGARPSRLEPLRAPGLQRAQPLPGPPPSSPHLWVIRGFSGAWVYLTSHCFPPLSSTWTLITHKACGSVWFTLSNCLMYVGELGDT